MIITKEDVCPEGEWKGTVYSHRTVEPAALCVSLGEAWPISRSQLIWFQGMCAGGRRLWFQKDNLALMIILRNVALKELQTIYWAIYIFFISVFKQRSGESVKVHQLDVAIPLHLKSQLRKGPPLGGGEGETESADTMPFVMLTRKGNKQQVRICPQYIPSSLVVTKCKW